VNGEHLRAFFWLQWRLRANQFKKGGAANAIVTAIVAGAAVLLAVVLFVVFFLVGLVALSDVRPLILVLVWDGIVCVFIFFWLIGLVAQLQRAEALALEKFLHLPVSLSGVFLLNYLSSLLSFNLIVFGPLMLGLSLGLIFSRGPAMLTALPLLAAFLLMVTALTYQFQGWLASLMVNKRRRRTIIVVVTTVFVLIVQLPNLWNMTRSRDFGPDALSQQQQKEQAEIDRAFQAGEIKVQEYNERRNELTRVYVEKRRVHNEETWQNVERIARLVNLCVPPGWLPLGSAAAAEGNPLPGLLGTLGFALIGGASLARAYRTTVRFHTGAFTAGKTLPAEAQAAPRSAAPGSAAPSAAEPKQPDAAAPSSLLERRLPWISEQAAAVALGGLRSLTRAPEVKMLLLTPIIMAVIFGSMALRGASDAPMWARPLFAVGGVAMILLTMVQLVGNQFGYDRSGFKIFVLSPARRGDILIGKNLAVAPLALTLSVFAIAFVQVAYPMRFDHLIAVLAQTISLYLLFSLVANCLSILAPMPVAAGTLKPSHSKMIPVLLHFAFLFVFPLVIAPVMAPIGIEATLAWLGWAEGAPIALALSLAECVGVAFLYRWLVGWQGVWLQSRELTILETVTAKAE
jgi:hypothetical protein